MEQVLVTGAGGFIGRAVVERLAKMGEYQVTAAVSGRHPVEFPEGVRVETADLLDEGARQALMERVRPDVMLHYAWELEKAGFEYSEMNIKWLEASLHLCRQFCRQGGKRFLLAGTGSEYGLGFSGYAERPQGIPGFNIYGSCKLALEQAASTFFANNGVQFVSARYFSVYGPGMADRTALIGILETLQENRSFFCKNPNNIWDYVYIDDAVEATVRLLRSDYCGPMNIASGEPMTMRQVFSTVAELAGHPELLTFEQNPGGCAMLAADVSLMESVLHYRCSTPFRAGLERTLQWRLALLDGRGNA